MKKTVKIIAGFGTVLLMLTGAGYGQEAVKTVEGFKIDPPKATKTKPAKAGKAVTVTGYPIAPVAATPTSMATVEGFALPEKDQVSIQRKASLRFSGETKVSEAKIKMTGDYNYLMIALHGGLMSGSVTVEMIDPKGEIRGKFNLKTDDLVVTGDKTSIQQMVNGDMQKDFRMPLSGEWIIRATGVTAEGVIDIVINQQYRPGMGTTEPIDVGVPLNEKKQ
ncbi:MAG: hypothetical protein NTV01_13795 [Bacteroidia bacterium]|nr:hypothetical protein [Bacteroidia bacterium]